MTPSRHPLAASGGVSSGTDAMVSRGPSRPYCGGTGNTREHLLRELIWPRKTTARGPAGVFPQARTQPFKVRVPSRCSAKAEVDISGLARRGVSDRGLRSIILRALPGLGDFLCAVPALRTMRANVPDARIALVGLPATRPLA